MRRARRVLAHVAVYIALGVLVEGALLVVVCWRGFYGPKLSYAMMESPRQAAMPVTVGRAFGFVRLMGRPGCGSARELDASELSKARRAGTLVTPSDWMHRFLAVMLRDAGFDDHVTAIGWPAPMLFGRYQTKDPQKGSRSLDEMGGVTLPAWVAGSAKSVEYPKRVLASGAALDVLVCGAIAGIGVNVVILPFALRRRRRARGKRCVECGYDLAGVGCGRCPECGTVCGELAPAVEADGACAST